VAEEAPPPSMIEEEVAVEEPEIVVEPAPEAPPAKRPGFWARLFGRKQPPVASPAVAEVPPVEEPVEDPVREPEPEPVPVEEPPAPPLQPVPDPEPDPDEPLPAAEEEVAPLDDDRTVAVLTEVLDNLGAAHHRPFSRG
jgi:hypothetical protein